MTVKLHKQNPIRSLFDYSGHFLIPKTFPHMHRYILLLCIFIISGCKKKDDPSPISISDRQLVLNNIGQNVAIRSFLDLQTAANSLRSYANTYIDDSTNMQKLLVLQRRWLDVAVAWKHASLYSFGPIENELLRSKIYTPANITGIESVISQGKPEFDVSYMNTLSPALKGLSAIEYLIYGSRDENNNAVLNSFESGGFQRTAYLRALCIDLLDQANLLMYKWSTGGEGYLTKFVASDGSGRSSSISMVAESMIEFISLIKNERIGGPKGVKNAGVPQPELVDGKYSDESVVLLRAEVQSLHNSFTGVKMGTTAINGINFLLDKAGAKSGDEMLSKKITDLFQSIYSKMEVITVPLSQAVVTRPAQVSELYGEVDKLEVLMKDDMMKNLYLKD